MLAHGAYVAQEAFVLGALHGAAFEQAAIVVGGEIFPVCCSHPAQLFRGGEGRLAGGEWSMVVGAYFGAAVAPVDAAPHLLRGAGR